MQDEVQLQRDERGLALVGDGMELRCDFARMLPRVKPGALSRELLVRAARMKGADAPCALDATAGLGEDSFLLAAAGFTVTMYERDETIAALLADGLARAVEDEHLREITARMTLVQDDSLAALQAMVAPGNAGPTGEQPCAYDVIYLDPMFPARRKSAAVKKKFQLLHNLEAPCEQEAELLAAALAARPRKVVVKRPAKGALLADAKPAYAISGKAVRFDVYTPASM